MRLTILGGCGAWPAAGQPCSGYLVETDGFRLLLDPGYATVSRLLERSDANHIDAVLVSHEHPDHCADLNPLLRARSLREDPAPPLPLYALPGTLDAVLALDHRMLTQRRHTYDVHRFVDGDRIEVGPFTVDVRTLPHSVPNAGMRISTHDASVAYTGDSAPTDAVVELARDTDLLLADASYGDTELNDELLGNSPAAARHATRAGCARLVLTHLLPGTDPSRAEAAARELFGGDLTTAAPGLTIDIA